MFLSEDFDELIFATAVRQVTMLPINPAMNGHVGLDQTMYPKIITPIKAIQAIKIRIKASECISVVSHYIKYIRIFNGKLLTI
ncbi:hypothetical protein [Providencia heimbachae]|uniref:hypothetical protein n=1 Tax=Providencia heimbachae TaxID=333962 RepID=UPI00223EC8E6|nr:hypothetical protein [Providencia heimbachae]